MSEPEETSQREPQHEPEPRKPGPLRVLMSVLAAAFGVQSEENREHDFTRGDPVTYILAGLIFTVVFVLTLIGVVMLVLPDG